MTKRALISVSDKAGIVEFAQELKKLGWDIISTGGTKVTLDNAGVDTIAIDDVTGFPEMMDGRVKTLHPNIHGGLLARRDLHSHLQAAKDNNIELIDLVVVNLYPFKETILKPDVTYADAVENIDIGGPSMLRSAAKNHASVTVVVDPADYAVVLDELSANGETTYETRQRLAAKVYRHTASYDALIAEYHKYPALPPVFDFMDNEATDKVRKVKPVWTADGYLLFWTAPKYKDEMNRAVQYVIYRFGAKEKVDISDPSHIVAITRDNFYKLPYENGKTKYRYVVTALDRLHNESKTVAKKVKL